MIQVGMGGSGQYKDVETLEVEFNLKFVMVPEQVFPLTVNYSKDCAVRLVTYWTGAYLLICMSPILSLHLVFESVCTRLVSY